MQVLRNVDSSLEQVTRSLNSYDGMGEEFNRLVRAYTHVMSNITTLEDDVEKMTKMK
jgi:hypothetical protein